MKVAIITAVLAGIFVSCLALYPQYHLRQIRGVDYNGAFATYDLDEMAYAAYLQAVIDGRPRKNDPYTGRDASPDSPQSESLFSIQFVTAYIAAVPARVLGISAAGMMPVISVFSAFFTTLALFWISFLVTRNTWLSLACALAVVAGGALISGIGVIGEFSEGGVAYPFLPFLRRHIPSMSFPFMFAFFGCLWRGMHSSETVKRTVWAVAAALCFAVLLFSYFYLWTTAIAAFLLISLFVLATDREHFSSNFKFVATYGAALLPFVAAYVWLLTGRSANTDRTQLLVFTHAPDLNRNIEIIGIGVGAIVLILLLIRSRGIERAEAAFVAALGLTSVVVFNQQVLSGRSLQPFHYEYYSANYVAIFAVALLFALLVGQIGTRFQPIRAVIVAVAVLAAVSWGIFETVESAKLWDDANVIRDEAMPVNLRIRELAALPDQLVTLNPEPLQADSQPSVARAALLWARHQHTFSGITGQDENRARYYRLLYYSDLDGTWLKDALKGCNNIEACMALFGWDRFNSTLSANARPLTVGEMDDEVRDYERFVAEFSRQEALEPVLNMLVIRDDDRTRFDNLDRWYEIGPAEPHGKYLIRKLTPKPQ